MRFIATGGVLKGILKGDEEITNNEMIHVNDDESEQSADTGERWLLLCPSISTLCL